MTAPGAQRDLAPGERSGIGAILSNRFARRICSRACASRSIQRTSSSLASSWRPGALSSSGEPELGRLLLADDNLINQKVAVAMLSSGGYRVDTALTGAEAVQAVAETPYDAILMDCQMPELNGYEATAAIRAQEGSDRHTPIIAGARREDRDRCLAEGMDNYLAKPINKEALLALVGRYVKNGQAQ